MHMKEIHMDLIEPSNPLSGGGYAGYLKKRRIILNLFFAGGSYNVLRP